MTFIIAIQLNNSIIVAVDNKEVVINEEGDLTHRQNPFSKIHPWEKGIITGAGESNLIRTSVELFKVNGGLESSELSKYLEISRKIREIELGDGYFQVQTTKLICSSYIEQGAQLYKLERLDGERDYSMQLCEPMEITVWMFNPNIEAISQDLKSLYSNLKDCNDFTNQKDWVNFYINRIAPIYKKQSKVDTMMSASFDLFFQTKDAYFYGHIPNTQKSQ